MLQQKLGLVTGAANGIGRSVAQIFAREGANVTLADLSKSSTDLVLKNLPNTEDHLSLGNFLTDYISEKFCLSSTSERFF